MAKEGEGKEVEEASNLDAYAIAKDGGRHSGWYNQFEDKDEGEIRRGIRSIEKQMQEHQDKILNPRRYIPGFDSLTLQEQEGLIKRKWPKDIQRQEEQKAILQGILKERGLQVMEDQTFRNYLHDLGTLIKEHAREAKEQKDSSEGSSSQAYGSGYVMAWYEVVSLMQQQAEAFGIPFESLDLHDIDPDKDLFRSVTIQKEAHSRRESAQTGGINGLRGQAP